MPAFYGQTCDPEFPATCCFHHIVVVTIPESNAACVRLVCAMRTLHTTELEFAKRFETSPAVKFSARMFQPARGARGYILNRPKIKLFPNKNIPVARVSGAVGNSSASINIRRKLISFRRRGFSFRRIFSPSFPDVLLPSRVQKRH